MSWFEDYEDPLFGRAIHWVFERNGNMGKSVIGAYLVDHGDGEVIMVSGAAKDMKFGVCAIWLQAGKMPKTIVVIIPRVAENHFSTAGVEAIKDGCFFSEKFESSMCRYKQAVGGRVCE